MKKFVIMHVGFKMPTPEIMAEWSKWFESIAPHTVDGGNLGFRGGREISDAGVKDLPMDLESITGVSIVQAESLDAAVKLAESNPYISSVRVYEVMSK